MSKTTLEVVLLYFIQVVYSKKQTIKTSLIFLGLDLSFVHDFVITH